MTNADEFVSLITRGREERILEYKESAPWDKLKDKIVRSALAMANCRDGGTIIIGVSQRGGTFEPEGVSADHLQTYDADEIQAAINRHADPYVNVEVHRTNWDGKIFIILAVYEFDDIPVVCKKDGNSLRHGAIYSRSYRMPESCEVRSQTEMREILDLAIDKGVRKFLRRAREVEIHVTDAEKFDKQLGDL